MKVEYIVTRCSLRDLASKYRVSKSNIFARSSRENWTLARKEYRLSVLVKALEKSKW